MISPPKILYACIAAVLVALTVQFVMRAVGLGEHAVVVSAISASIAAAVVTAGLWEDADAEPSAD